MKTTGRIREVAVMNTDDLAGFVLNEGQKPVLMSTGFYEHEKGLLNCCPGGLFGGVKGAGDPLQIAA